jgi:hypothetical protein
MDIAKRHNTAPIHFYLLFKMYVPDGVRIFVWFQPNVVVHAQFALGDSDVRNKLEVRSS